MEISNILIEIKTSDSGQIKISITMKCLHAIGTITGMLIKTMAGMLIPTMAGIPVCILFSKLTRPDVMHSFLTPVQL